MAVVIDEYGTISGLITIEDVLEEMTYIFRSKIPEEIWPTPNL